MTVRGYELTVGEGALAGPRAPASTRARARPRGRLASLVPLLALSALCLLASWECHLELWHPEASALAWLHARGWFLDVEIGYVPGRGLGRALGIAGATMMVALLGYSLRKRLGWLAGAGRLSRWLDVHIALGLAGPALVTLHTAGRLGGIISVAYWSMIAVVASGVVGRYLYAQVPRTISGRERSLADVGHELAGLESRDLELARERGLRALRRDLAARGVDRDERVSILRRVRRARELERQLAVLERTRRLLSLWHRVHVPLVCVLYGIMALHIAVAVLFDTRG